MSDKDELMALLTRWGVRFEERECDFYGHHCDGRELIIRVKQQDGSGKEIGYNGFYTDFYFNRDGMFGAMGAWE